jgi:hypothetical protein
MIPMRPAVSGIAQTAVEVVCSSTCDSWFDFSVKIRNNLDLHALFFFFFHSHNKGEGKK